MHMYKDKLCVRAKWPIRPKLIPVSVARRDYEYFYFPPGWEVNPSQSYPPALNSPVPIYTPKWKEAL